MYIKSVNHNIKDVFLGDGWDNWVRIDMRTNSVVSSSLQLNHKLQESILNKVRNFFKKH